MWTFANHVANRIIIPGQLPHLNRDRAVEGTEAGELIKLITMEEICWFSFRTTENV